MFVAFPKASAQMTTDMRKTAVIEMRKQLPMEVAEGMKWTKVDLSKDGQVMVWTFKVNPREMGSTLSEAKEELNSYTNSEFKSLLGDDFDEMLQIYDCDVQIIIEFPDNTSKKFRIRK